MHSRRTMTTVQLPLMLECNERSFVRRERSFPSIWVLHGHGMNEVDKQWQIWSLPSWFTITNYMGSKPRRKYVLFSSLNFIYLILRIDRPIHLHLITKTIWLYFQNCTNGDVSRKCSCFSPKSENMACSNITSRCTYRCILFFLAVELGQALI